VSEFRSRAHPPYPPVVCEHTPGLRVCVCENTRPGDILVALRGLKPGDGWAALRLRTLLKRLLRDFGFRCLWILPARPEGCGAGLCGIADEAVPAADGKPRKCEDHRLPEPRVNNATCCESMTNDDTSNRVLPECYSKIPDDCRRTGRGPDPAGSEPAQTSQMLDKSTPADATRAKKATNGRRAAGIPLTSASATRFSEASQR